MLINNNNLVYSVEKGSNTIQFSKPHENENPFHNLLADGRRRRTRRRRSS